MSLTRAAVRGPRQTQNVSADTIQKVTARACSLQGMPEAQYHLLDADSRERLEAGCYRVFAALESLGWRLVPPEEAPTIWLPGRDFVPKK